MRGEMIGVRFPSPGGKDSVPRDRAGGYELLYEVFADLLRYRPAASRLAVSSSVRSSVTSCATAPPGSRKVFGKVFAPFVSHTHHTENVELVDPLQKCDTPDTCLAVRQVEIRSVVHPHHAILDFITRGFSPLSSSLASCLPSPFASEVATPRPATPPTPSQGWA